MKLLFSEAVPDAVHYVYPYAVWGFLEPEETPADAFSAGFLPGGGRQWGQSRIIYICSASAPQTPPIPFVPRPVARTASLPAPRTRESMGSDL